MAAAKAISPEVRAVRLLSTQIRLRDPKALKRVITLLQKNDGAVTRVAEQLGVTTKTVYSWIAEVPELSQHTRGRAGRPPVKQPKKSRRPS